MTLPTLYAELPPEARQALDHVRDTHEVGLQRLGSLMATVVGDFEKEAQAGPTRRLRKYAHGKARVYRNAGAVVVEMRRATDEAWRALGVPAAATPVPPATPAAAQESAS